MLVDENIGSTPGSSGAADAASLAAEIRRAEADGLDGVWSVETSRDPFLPLVLATQSSSRLRLGTGIAVAFARNPMTLAVTANDLQEYSGGRFTLGLGSQIKAHVERRFSMPWSRPAARMAEFVAALKAIWSAWDDGTRLDFRGDFYQHTLMTPMFTPTRHDHGPPPVLVAAVGPQMTRTAATVADGLLVHAFTTERYLREVSMPIVSDGLRTSGRDRADFTVSFPGLLATADDEGGLHRAIAAVRKQIAFYGSTPAYRGVLELHGWGALADELHALSVRREWDVMATLVDDEVLQTFAAVGAPEVAAAQLRARFDGIVDRYTLYAPYDLDAAARRAVVTALHAS